jgi:uncharacterized protein (DUF58 family)
MLRAVVIAATAILSCAGVALIAQGVPRPGWGFLALGLVLLLATLFERWRYRPVAKERPDGGWQSTRERFIDPSTGATIEVLFNPETGERHYVSGTAPRTTEPPP